MVKSESDLRIRDTARKWAYTQDDPTLRDLFANVTIVRIHLIVFDSQINRRGSFVIFELCADLIGYGLDPWDKGQIQVGAECLGKRLRLNEMFVEIPDKAVPDSVCVCFKLDANWNKGCWSSSLRFQCFRGAVHHEVSEGPSLYTATAMKINAIRTSSRSLGAGQVAQQ